MLIILTHLPDDGLKFEHQYEANELDLSPFEFSLPQPPFVNGRVTKLGEEMRVKGSLSAQLSAECDRCLEPVTLPIATDFDLYYLPAETHADKSGETELLERELGVSFYQNERIDVDELVLEQLELSLPARILCSQDCRGLCQQCGANLNIEQCHCQPLIDPRWQALSDLKS